MYIQLLYYKRLLPRLPSNHPQFLTMQDKLAQAKAGLYGELRVLRELQDLPNEFFWLTDFQCFSLQQFTHQIDFLILTPRCAIILEVKNTTGNLSYQPFQHEFYRTKIDGQVDVFRNPFDQAYRHQCMLEQYFSLWQIDLPICYAVVIVNKNVRLDASFGQLPIFHVSYLRKYLHELQKHFPIANIDFVKLHGNLKATATILPPRRIVDKHDLQCGILCKHCLNTMIYKGGLCSCRCGFATRDGVQQTMLDYQVLVGERITNQEFRRFTHIDDVYTASKILTRLGYEKHGKNRGVYYIISELNKHLSNNDVILSNKLHDLSNNT